MNKIDVEKLRATATEVKKRLDEEAAIQRAEEARKKEAEERARIESKIKAALYRLDVRVQGAAAKGEFHIEVFRAPYNERNKYKLTREVWNTLEQKIAEMGLKPRWNIDRVEYPDGDPDTYDVLEARWD